MGWTSRGGSRQPGAEPSPLLPPGLCRAPSKVTGLLRPPARQPSLGMGDLARGTPPALSGCSWGAWLCHSTPALPPVIKRLIPNLPSLSVFLFLSHIPLLQGLIQFSSVSARFGIT